MKSVFFASVSVVTDDCYGKTGTLEGTYQLLTQLYSRIYSTYKLLFRAGAHV
jgi:hypothetical protein